MERCVTRTQPQLPQRVVVEVARVDIVHLHKIVNLDTNVYLGVVNNKNFNK
jgi:hypothetical protein